MATDFGSLRGFLKAAKGRSQEDVIIEFLAATVLSDPISDQGSVLINHPYRETLITFNEGDFLFKKKILDPQERESWPSEVGYYDSVAGLCFRTKETQTYQRKDNVGDSSFFGNSPIQNMVCIPIMTGGKHPFGVVCFHNNNPEKSFSDANVKILESYVDVLAVALHNPLPELNLERNVFIVHGRDEASLNELQLLLFKYRVTPKVLVDKNKGPKSILEELEGLIRICKAGFILATPDDEGHLRGTNVPLVHRARENVVFETGLLFAKFREFERVALLLKAPTALPSDLNGIAYLSFEKVADIEAKIVEKLQEWRLVA